MNQILIINGNDVYEIDDDCVKEKEKEKQEQTNNK